MSDDTKFKVGQVWRAKRPAPAGTFFGQYVNDRLIRFVGEETVQYDGPSVAWGRKYPTVSKEAFEKWAAREVTDELPGCGWSRWNNEDRSKNK